MPRARALLAEAGLGGGVGLVLICYADQTSQQRVEILIEQCKAAGIRLSLSSAPLPEATSRRVRVTCCCPPGRVGPTLSYALMFGTGAFYNAGRTGTPALDDAIARMRASAVQADRGKAFAEVQAAVREQALFAPLLFQSQTIAAMERMLRAAVVIEAVFAIPGIGSTVVQGVVLAMVVVVIVVNLVIDALYALVDSRVSR